MSLVDAKCTNCGSPLKVDNTQEAAVCEFCGSAFIVEKAINNYSINIQNAVINMPNVKLDNLKKLGDEKIKEPHYPFEMDEYEKAQDYFLKVLEFEYSEEYKLKADLCEKALHTERVSLSDTITIIESVSEFIKKDEQTESFNNDRITVYADTIRIMTDALEAITMYYYKRLSSASLNASVYASVLINLAEKIAEFSYSLIEYNQNSEIVEVVLSLCGSAQSNLSSCLPVYIPNLSKETYERIPIVAAKVEEVGKRFKDSYTVREDLLDISKSNSDNTGNNSNGCYVATAVYGSYDCPQVWTLRRYRDNQLAKTWYGRAFIYTYYAISPTIVKLFGNTAWFKKMWRGKLDRMVQNLNSNGVENTPYNDIEW